MHTSHRDSRGKRALLVACCFSSALCCPTAILAAEKTEVFTIKNGTDIKITVRFKDKDGKADVTLFDGPRPKKEQQLNKGEEKKLALPVDKNYTVVVWDGEQSNRLPTKLALKKAPPQIVMQITRRELPCPGKRKWAWDWEDVPKAVAPKKDAPKDECE